MKQKMIKRILSVMFLSLGLLLLPIAVRDVKAVTFSEGKSLSADLKVNGDLILEKGDLILNGHTLTVTGDFIMENGRLVIGNGTLSVGRDMRIQRKVNDGWSWSDGALQMDNSKGKIKVTRHFYTSSTANYNSTSTPNNILSAGTIYVGGDFRQEYYGYNGDAFSSTGTKVVMNGNKQQVIKFDKPMDSGFYDLSLKNSNIKIESMIRGFKLTEDLTFDNDMAFGTYGTFDLNGKKMTIKGDLLMGSLDGPADAWGHINVNGGTLKVGGNLTQQKGTLTVGSGTVEIGKTYRLQRRITDSEGKVSYSWSDGALVMNNKNGVMKVGGSFYTSSTANYNSTAYPNNILSAGTIYVGGDFRQEYYGYNGDAFASTGTKVVMNGKKQQVIKFDKPMDSYFYDLNLKNSNIKIESMIRGFKLTEDLTFDNDMAFGTYGTFDLNGKKMTIKGDLLMGSLDGPADLWGHINVNGGTLKVGGNLIQQKGTLTVGSGTVEIGKNYRLQRKITDSNGKVSYSWSDGALVMTNKKGVMKVGGSFYTSSTANYNATSTPNTSLTAGNIYVGGDFRQEYYGYNGDAFPSKGTTVTLNGTKKQTVSFDKPYDSYFSDLVLENSNIVFDTMIKGWKLSTDTVCDNGMPNATCGVFDLNGKTLKVKGNMVIGDRGQNDHTKNGSVNVNKGKFIVTGNLRQEQGTLTVGGGTVYIGGDYRIQRYDSSSKAYSWSDGCLKMNNSNDLLIVKGSFYCSSTANYNQTSTPNNDISAGVMEVGGDFRQEYYGYNGDAFFAEGNHTVVLNGTGTKIQTVKFDKYPQSILNKVVLTRDSQYYKFDPAGCYNKLETNKSYTTKYDPDKDKSLDKKEDIIITFDPNGGKITSGEKKVNLSKVKKTKLPKVVRKGYALDGWYTKKTGGKKLSGTNIYVSKSATYYARWTKVSSPSKTSIKSVTAKSKGFKVTWKKVKNVSGYEIRYSTQSNMKNYKTVNAKASATSATVSKLSASKKYYIAVYAYTKDSAGNKYYSKVSNIKSIKTKK